MKERPILFQGAMVRAILAGTKTQTRRAVNWRNVNPGLNLSFTGLQAVNQDARGWVLTSMGGSCWQEQCAPTPCPYGAPDDRLWGRETFFAFGRWETRFSAEKGRDEWHFVDMTLETGHAYCYVADGAEPALLRRRRSSGITPGWWKRPAIFMPRAASRILLEITGVRVERLQAISEADALAEGCPGGHGAIPGYGYSATPVEQYQHLWNSINGVGSWDANPWVWIVEFRKDPS